VGRLFWKFFAFVWLAQLGGIVAMGALFWLTAPHQERTFSEVAAGPLAAMEVRAGAEILRYAGTSAFGSWSERASGPAVFAVDVANRDVLGRTVPNDITAEVRRLQQERPDSPQLSEVAAEDGRHYTVFALDSHPDSSAPPGSPPHPPTPHFWPRGLPPPMALLVTLAASAITAVLLARYVAKPIRSLRGAFEAVAAGNLDRRIAARISARNDELADLGRDFDRMAARLETSMEGQRRLLHDVSHELRSPLARLQAAVGLMRQSPDQPAAMITRIEDESMRIDRLIGKLLALSRLEAGEWVGAEDKVDMHELIQEVVHDANFEARADGRQIIWKEAGSVSLQGRPELLHSAIENVVRNALKHASGSRTIQIETAIDTVREQYTLRVLDEGPGIPEDELHHLFTPFYRGSNATGTDSYGLGLAIARRCVEAHGGTIRAENRAGGGLQVEIALPWNRHARPEPC
jgi:two-component system, OmpR family, sensor kinase